MIAEHDITPFKMNFVQKAELTNQSFCVFLRCTKLATITRVMPANTISGSVIEPPVIGEIMAFSVQRDGHGGFVDGSSGKQ